MHSGRDTNPAPTTEELAGRDPRVVLIRSGRTGKVDPVEPCLLGTAVVEDDPQTVPKVEQLTRPKYGFEFVLVTTIEATASGMRPPTFTP